MSKHKDEERLADALHRKMLAALATIPSGMNRQELVDWLGIEVGELLDHIRMGRSPDEVWESAANVASYAAMIADRYDRQEEL